MSAEGAQIEAERSRKPARKSRAKLKLLSLAELDHRTAAAREALAMRDNLLAERGGADRLSTLKLAVVESVSCLTAMISDAQARWLRGDPVDATALTTLINARRREAEIIGIDPGPLDVTPDLRSYLKGKAA